MYEERKYRDYTSAEGLVKFQVVEGTTDLLVLADKNLRDFTRKLVLQLREQLITFINQNPKFYETLEPYKVPLFVPPLIRNMAWAAKRCKVGPMAAVAGAIAELVGKELLLYSKEVIVENGGDNFMKISRPRKVGVFAGPSPFSEKIALEIEPQDTPCGICTSSGTVGPSLSFGKADAVCVISRSAALADAAATAIGNVVKDAKTIDKGLALAKKIRGLKGVLIIKGDKMGIMGKIKIIPI